MSKLGEATGAPVALKLADGEYFFSPLTLNDLGEFEEWAEQNFWERLKVRLARMPEKMRPELKQRAYNDVEKGIAQARAMMTMEGTARLAWLSLRARHPGLKPDDAGRLITVENLPMVQELLDRSSGLAAKKGDDRPPVKKAGKKHPAEKK